MDETAYPTPSDEVLDNSFRPADFTVSFCIAAC